MRPLLSSRCSTPPCAPARDATPPRLKGCGLGIASPLIAHADDEPAVAEAPVRGAAPRRPPPVDDARDRAKRHAEFSKTLRRTYDKNQLNAAHAEMVSFEKELARIAPTKEAAEGAKELKQVLRGLYDAAKRDDRRAVQGRSARFLMLCRTWPTPCSPQKMEAFSWTSSRSASCGATGSRGRATRPSNR